MTFEAEQFLTEVLGARHVTRRGDELVHPCLLREHEHDAETPGASLNQEKLLYNCFKCGAGGTLLWATEEILDIDASKARKLIQGTFQPDEISPETFLNMIEDAWESTPGESMPHYNLSFIENWMCPTNYMDDRGISREVQKEMMTGLNPTSTDKIGDEVLVQPRIVIPHVFRGVLRGWSMRIIDKRQVGTKYKHSHQFPKSVTLYNYDMAKKFDQVIVVESPMSVLKLMTYGIRNAVATFGAEVNPEQVNLLSKWDSVVCFPDGDEPGYRALSHMDRKGNVSGLVHELRTETWVVDHGRIGGVAWNEKDPADYPVEHINTLLALKVPANTWDYMFVPEKIRKKTEVDPVVKFVSTADQEYWSS